VEVLVAAPAAGGGEGDPRVGGRRGASRGEEGRGEAVAAASLHLASPRSVKYRMICQRRAGQATRA